MYPKYNLLHYTYTVPRKCYRGRHSEVLITITVTPIIAVMLGNARCLSWVMLTSDARYNAAYDTQQEHHGIMGRRFPDGGLLKYRK